MVEFCRKIQIASSSEKLADWVSKQFADTGKTVVCSELAEEKYSLSHNCAGIQTGVFDILDRLAPFSPPVFHEPDLEEGTLVIALAPVSERLMRVGVRAESGSAQRQFEQIVTGLPVVLAGESIRIEHVNRSLPSFDPQELKIYHGQLDLFSYHLMLWLSRVAEQPYRIFKSDLLPDGFVQIDYPDARAKGLSGRERLKLLVKSDCPAGARQVVAALRQSGFSASAEVETEISSRRFTLTRLPHLSVEQGDALLETRIVLEEQLIAQGVSPVDFPVANETEALPGALDQVLITWPIRAATSGELRPYAGSRKERFSIVVHSDDSSIGSELTERLVSAGYVGAGFSHSRCQIKDLRLSFATSFPDKRRLELFQLVSKFMVEKDVPEEYLLTIAEQEDVSRDDDEASKVDIFFAVDGVFDRKRIPTLESPRGYWDLTIYVDDPKPWSGVVDELNTWGFGGFSVDEVDGDKLGDDGRVRIAYGGAPVPLLDRIKRYLELEHGLGPVVLRKQWHDRDDDIWIYLPRRSSLESDDTAEVVDDDSAPDWPHDRWAQTSRVVQRPWLLRSEKEVLFGHRRVNRQSADAGSLAPEFRGFAHFCLDQQTVETLDFVAESIVLGEPCLLEGDTATSKTSSVMFVAACIGQPVLRLNLHGQTDTGELVGRFAPATTSARRFEALRALRGDEAFLEPRSQEILATAREEQRELSSAELAKVASLEGQPVLQWAWIEGAVLTAMRKGWWLLLDELNLAEPQILERLNSLLEQPPSLVVSEFDNRIYGGKGRPIAKGFQMFATMNPASYAGRTSLSPAYRDRWLAHRIVPAPDESGFRAMLELLVFGRQPEVALHDVRWAGSQVNPMFPTLAQISGMSSWLDELASFHAALCRPASGGGEASAKAWSSRRDAHVFSRRALLSVLRFLAQFCQVSTSAEDVRVIFRRAIQRYYLDPVDNGAERRAIIDLMHATGLGNRLGADGVERDDH